MTVEEISNCLEQIKNIILNSNSWTGEAKTIVEKCFNSAIKSLEAWEKVKEVVEDKIGILEDELKDGEVCLSYYYGKLAGLSEMLEIIDKYTEGLV